MLQLPFFGGELEVVDGGIVPQSDGAFIDIDRLLIFKLPLELPA